MRARSRTSSGLRRSRCKSRLEAAREISSIGGVAARGAQTLSQQRRALLLPQEVKELGTEEAIVFYEGLRPIRCRKIRYFTDPRFRKRLLPPPPAPLPPGRTGPVSTPAAREPPSADSCNEALGTPDTATAAAQPRKEDVVIREGTVEDIERIESLTLEDFATDFSKVPDPRQRGPAFGWGDEGRRGYVLEFDRTGVGGRRGYRNPADRKRKGRERTGCCTPKGQGGRAPDAASKERPSRAGGQCH